LVLSIYAGISSSYVLNRFADEVSRYALFSVHQGAQGACARLAVRPYTPDELGRLLRENNSASGFVFAGQSGSLIAERRVADAGLGGLDAARLWQLIGARVKGGQLTNFTVDETLGDDRYFLSACRVDTASEGSLWLLYAAQASEVMKAVVALLAQIGTLFVAALFVVLGIFYVFAKSLTKPLGQLTELADDLSAGNYTRTVKVAGSDELGVLADSFSLLSQRLNDRESALEKSTELANQDFLTGLWNRRYLDRRAQEHFSLSKRHGHDLSLMYLDADYFKKINDTYGHAAGDEVLRDLAAILTAQLRKTDFVARVGGEEFVMVLPETGLDGAIQAAVKLREAIKGHAFLGEKATRLTVSLGVVSIGENAGLASAAELTEAADKFAYQSKTTGRDRISSPRGQIV
jgi:diguanylate cyclase (GGDEF)-like protein